MPIESAHGCDVFLESQITYSHGGRIALTSHCVWTESSSPTTQARAWPQRLVHDLWAWLLQLIIYRNEAPCAENAPTGANEAAHLLSKLESQ